jgi:HlyD family secretion protein
MRTRAGAALAVLALGLIAAVVIMRARPSGLLVETTTVARTDRLQSFVTASGEIVASRYADIGAAVMGRLVSLPVKEGDRVTAGQVLARIDPVQAASGADAAAASLRALEAEARGAATQVTVAQASLNEAEARKTEAAQSLARARELQQAGLLPQSEFDKAQADADAATAQAASAAAALQRARDARDAADRRIAQGRAETVRARDQLAKTEITAPIDGVVTRLDVEEGEMVVIGVQNQPGTILMTVSDLSAINAEVKVAEADVMRLTSGNEATVTFEAIPGRRYTGKVIEIGASALPQVGAQAAAREFRVRVRLENADISLRPGLTCDAEILVATRTDVLTVPLQAVVERNGQAGVFVAAGDVARFTPVTTGIIGGLAIEVTGVDAGATIVSGPFQALREIQDGAQVRTR